MQNIIFTAPETAARPGRVLPFGLSLLVHALLVVFLANVARLFPQPPVRASAARAEMLSRKYKLVWYTFRQPPPDVSPAGAKRQEPRAPEKSENAVVVRAPDQPKRDQLVYNAEKPEPPPEPKKLANLLAFQPPKEPPKQAAALAEPPKLEASNLPAGAEGPSAKIAAPPPKPRAFVAPKAAAPKTAPLLAAPELASGSASGVSLTAAGAAPGAGRIDAPPPKPRAFGGLPGAGRSGKGSAKVVDAPELASAGGPDLTSLRAAVIGLTPGGQPGVPEGTQLASIAAAPNTGPARAGGGGGVEVKELDLTLRGGGAGAGAAGNPPGAVIADRSIFVPKTLYTPEPVIAQRRAMRSVPQAPAVIPAHVRDALGSRHIYLAPIEVANAVSYSGGWLLWFAERTPLPGNDPAMQPPIPFRFVDPVSEQSTIASPAKGKLRILAVIRATGFLDNARVISGVDPAADKAIQDSLRRWTFQPALRSGVRVDIDVLLEVPLALAPRPAVAARGSN